MEQISQILREVSRCGRQYRDERLSPLGLSTRHGLYLREIGENPGISQEQLSQKLAVNKSNVARQVAAMEEEGYLQRRACGKDKRVLRLELTEKGAALLPQIRQIMDAWEQLLVRSFTDSEKQILHILMLRLLENGNAALQEVDL